MIRIKCPKCASALSLDDDEAGQVRECTECGARFRVPAAKPGAPPRSRKANEDKRRPAGRGHDDEDDEDEFDDENDDELDDGKDKATAKPRGGGKPKGSSADTEGNVQMAISLVAFVLLIGVASMFIRRLGMMVAFGSLLLFIACAILVSRTGLSAGGKGIRFAMIGGACLVLCGLCVFGSSFEAGRMEARRLAVKENLVKNLGRNQPR